MSELYIGTDLVDIARIKKLIDKHNTKFLNKIFSIKEQRYCNSKPIPEIHYAGRFAAKEAIIKAIKSSRVNIPIDFNSIVVLNKSDGAPYVELDKTYNCSMKISISHTDTHAISFALLVLNK